MRITTDHVAVSVRRSMAVIVDAPALAQHHGAEGRQYPSAGRAFGTVRS
jgi:hypothetical protein